MRPTASSAPAGLVCEDADTTAAHVGRSCASSALITLLTTMQVGRGRGDWLVSSLSC